MKIEQVLEHPWIVGKDSRMARIRRKSADMGNKILKFVTYSNMNMEKIREHSPGRDKQVETSIN